MHIFSMLHNFYYSKNVALLRPYGQFSSHNQINKVALKKISLVSISMPISPFSCNALFANTSFHLEKILLGP